MKRRIGKGSLKARGLAEKKKGKLSLTGKGRERLAELFIDKEKLVKTMKELRKYSPSEVAKTRSHIKQGFFYAALNYAPVLVGLEKLLKGFKGKNVLEIGFGDVPFLLELKKKGANVAGIDRDPVRLKEKQLHGIETRKLVKELNLKKGELTALEQNFPGKSFHAIVAVNVMDLYDVHEEYFREASKRVHEKLKRGGFFVVGGSTELNSRTRKIFEGAGFKVLAWKLSAGKSNITFLKKK